MKKKKNHENNVFTLKQHVLHLGKRRVKHSGTKKETNTFEIRAV